VVLSLPQSYIVKPFATILKDLPQPCWHWLTGGTFDSATGGTFQSDTDGTFHSDIPGTFESDMGGTFKVLQSINYYNSESYVHRCENSCTIVNICECL
jgi:hypothetical protein